MTYQAKNQTGADQQQQEDNKVFARHVIFKDTKTGGSIVTMFFSPEEAAKIAADIQEALTNESSEGMKLAVVTGEGKNGKPYALVGASPLYPSANGNSGQQASKPAYQAKPQASGGYKPNASGGSKPNTSSGYKPNTSGANKPSSFSNKKL